MLNIFAPSLTPRLRYTFDLVFNTLLKTPYTLTDDKPFFEKVDGPKISYGISPVADSLFFAAEDLLFEEDIRQQHIKTFVHDQNTAFFKQADKNSALPFDLFALVFYLVSRYEEYIPSKRDHHNRFPANQSLAYQEKFLEKPLINIHVAKLRNLISNRFPHLHFPVPQFSFQPTFDIDYAWAFKHKGIARNGASLFIELVSGRLKDAKTRLSTVFGSNPDPFYTFNTIFEIHNDLPKPPVFFFLIGNYGLYDKNVSIRVPAFQELIKAISGNYPIGLHPSYQSHVSKKLLNKELVGLSTVTSQTVTKSRQHFLKFELPQTYRQLEELGITDEYSMGYAEAIGFRASIANPFPWFDLPANRESQLIIHPFQVMDITLNQYLELSPEKAIEQIRKLVAITREFGGEFCSLWHNNSLYFEGLWKNWDNVYLQLIDTCMVEQ